MSKAFRQIRQNLPMTQSREIQLKISGNSISIAGHVSLHQSKVSKQIYDSLIENNLIDPTLQEIAGDPEKANMLTIQKGYETIIMGNGVTD
jgi:hypothetical protein